MNYQDYVTAQQMQMQTPQYQPAQMLPMQPMQPMVTMPARIMEAPSTIGKKAKKQAKGLLDLFK